MNKIKKDKKEDIQKISIIIPVYNEEKNIKSVINKVISSKTRNLSNEEIEKEIIIVDDKSTDNSAKKIRDIKEKGVKKIFQEKNQGKGAAIRTGIKNSTGQIILIQDADLEYNPDEYQKLINPILEEKTKVVYGSRFLNKRRNKNQKITYYMGNKSLSLITSILYFKKITDMETCYKVFKEKVIKNLNLKSDRFEIEPEITSKLIKKKYRIMEIPIDYQPRSHEEGKKIKSKDYFLAIKTLLRYRFYK